MPAAVHAVGIVRTLLFVGAALAGAAVGLLGSFKFGYTTGGAPVGLLVALALSGAVEVAAGLALGSRAGAAVCGVAWFAATAAMSYQRPEGDLVVPATALGYAWLLLGTLLTVAALAPPYGALAARRAVRDATATGAESSGVTPTSR